MQKISAEILELRENALRLGDHKQFRQLTASYLRLREQVNQWQRYLVQLETLGLHRNEVAVTGEFLQSINALTNSMLRGASPEEITKMLINIEKALEKSQALEETLSIAMEASSESIFADESLDESKLIEVAETMKQEALSDEETAMDKEISQSLKHRGRNEKGDKIRM